MIQYHLPITSWKSTNPAMITRNCLNWVIFVGGISSPGIRFKKPGACHRTWWMAKIIYAMKICMFKQQFTLTKSEEKGLRYICCFAVEVYIRSWYTAPVPRYAPRLDLQQLKTLVRYKESEEKIETIALKKFSNHLWYLSKEL